jgi:hypothetical protein
MAIPKTLRAAVVEKFREPLALRELDALPGAHEGGLNSPVEFVY